MLWIRIQWGPWIRIRIRIRNPNPDPGGQKLPTNIEKKLEISVLRAEGFSCSLDVLYGGLGISKLQFLIKKKKKNSAVFGSP